MTERKSQTETAERTPWFVLAMQEAWKKEIEEAIEKVKRRIPVTRREWPRRRRKRGYWTPVGFAWFKKEIKRRNYKRRASNCHAWHDL